MSKAHKAREDLLGEAQVTYFPLRECEFCLEEPLRFAAAGSLDAEKLKISQKTGLTPNEDYSPRNTAFPPKLTQEARL
jgi:hypothetical protein